MTIFNLGYGGGGGGGGAGGGAAGDGGTAAVTGLPGETTNNFQGRPGSNGNGRRSGYRGYNGDFGAATVGSAGWGGLGGGFGQAGYAGDAAYEGTSSAVRGLGGAGGNSIVGGANITWKAHGVICGNIDNWGTWGGTGANNSALMSPFTDSAKETFVNGGAWIFGIGGSGNGVLGDGQIGNRWFWNAPNAGYQNQPGGSVTFAYIYTNQTGGNIIAHLYGAVDNSLTTLNVNGSVIAAGTTMPFNTLSETANFTLVNGCNVIRVTLNNSEPSIAGFNLRLRRSSDNFVLGGPEGWFF